MPPVNISIWKGIFDALMVLDCFVIIEDEINEIFDIGIIEKTFKNTLHFKSFDADGIWDDVALEIPYSQVTAVKWETRYAKVWQEYLHAKQNNDC